MKSFVDWVDEDKFIVRRPYDSEKGELVKIKGPLTLFPHQRKIFGYALTQNEDGLFPHETFVYSTPKKSGKTCLLAGVGCWYAEEGPSGSEIYSLANDLEQAEGRAFREMKFHAEQRGREPQKYRIDYPGGSFIQVLASHYRSAAGAHQALTLWDELWGYHKESSTRLWEEMTPVPTEKQSLRFVATYAGFEEESDLLWGLYEMTVLNGERMEDRFPDLPMYVSKDGSVLCYWNHEPRMPWQTPSYYESQMHTLRPGQFLRLHRNEWASSEDKFIDVSWYDRQVDLEAPLDMMPDDEHAGFPVYVGIDVGVKHDTTALVGVWYDYATKDVGLAFCDIWEPTGDDILDLEATVETKLRQYYSDLNIVSVWADPTHFYRSITGLKKEGLPIEEFKQTAPNMTSATSTLYDLLQFRKIKFFQHEELRDHIRFSTAKPSGSSFRISRAEEGRNPNDGCVALAIACYNAVSHGGHDTSQEITIRSGEAELTGLKPSGTPDDKGIPEALGGPRDWTEFPADLRPTDWSN